MPATKRFRRALPEAGHAVDLAAGGETEPYDTVVLDLGLARLG